jgi:phage tail sheath protein FI
MSETLISPGIQINENDQSFITQQVLQAGAAIIGPAVKGPVNIPTIITTYSDYTSTFGESFTSGSQTYEYFTSISAKNYFDAGGGGSLLVTRVVSGSFTPATASINMSGSSSPSFIIETLSEGVIMNNAGPQNLNGSLVSGSVDNVRWDIPSVDIDKGTFTLRVRPGNDLTASPTPYETFNNLSLDPYSNNYIEKRIGNSTQNIASDAGDYYLSSTGSFANLSRYIRVKSVLATTPNYLDNSNLPKAIYTGSLPFPSSGSFDGAQGSNIPSTPGEYYDKITGNLPQGIPTSSYNDVIQLLANKEAYQYKFITTPGLIYANHLQTVTSLINMVQERNDTMAIIDSSPYGMASNVGGVVSNVQLLDTSFAATYWPWVQLNNSQNTQVWVPASTIIPNVYASNDRVSKPWFAPAGVNRGRLTQVSQLERVVTQSVRDDLYKANINPITLFPGYGTTVYGQKTLSKKPSALDRVNVRRLLIELKSFIGQFANTLVFEQNNQITRDRFLTQVNSYLNQVQLQQGLDDFSVVMDETNNTPDVIDNNQLVGQVYIKPTRSAEFILLEFNILPSSATLGG